MLLGDGETWSRQSIDFGGLPEMVRTFLQVAAGAADIPVTRLLGQSPAGLSATGDSDTRNYYDMISSRQELDLRPQLERLDALVLRAAGVDPGAVRFEFRPLWQLTAAEKAQVALQKAQTTAVYAGLSLWPVAVTGALVRSQLLQDGIYPGAAATFEAADADPPSSTEARKAAADFTVMQLRDPDGRWASEGGAARPIIRAAHINEEPETGEPEDPNEEELRKEEDRLREMLPGSAPNNRPGSLSLPNPVVQPQVSPAPAEAGSGPAMIKPKGVPDHWIERPSDRGGGSKWADPDNPNRNMRVMPGNPNSPYPYQQQPYVIHQDGSYRDVNGKPIPGPNPKRSPDAHIPASVQIRRVLTQWLL